MKIKYVSKRFGAPALEMIAQANAIIAEYDAQGFELTLRQLYYQFVSRDLLANKQKEYKRLGSVINDARLAGLVSWRAIIDRTRNLESNSHFSGPHEIVEACADQFQIDKWSGQENRVEVWIEKDALIGVIEAVCRRMDVAYFSCRGYTSQSEVWAAGMRLRRYADDGQTPVVIHLGDHDPSGIDMTRDIEDRLRMFVGQPVEVNRIALNMDQVEKYNPPPNPAKMTDSRATGYVELHGYESWELDALEPAALGKLIEKTIGKYLDKPLYRERISEEQAHKARLREVAEQLESED